MYTHDSAPPSHPSRAHGTSKKSKARQQPVPLTTIAVMGATGSGKTSFINMASGSALRIGSDLESCTAEVQLADEFTLDGRPVVLIDTPGFDDTNKSDTDILKLIAAFLATSYEAGFTLAGVIYIHRISDNRFSGISGRNFKMFRELCGDKSLENVILVTNMWGKETQDVGEAREKELTTKFLKPVLDKGARLARHHDTIKSAHDIIRSIMKNKPLPLQIQTELVTEGKDILHTSAGEVINKELNEAIRRHQAELKSVQEEMMQALKDKDEETRQELEAETRKLQEQMNKMRLDSEGMASNYQEEKKRLEAEMKQMQDQARKERERAEAETRKLQEEMNKARLDSEGMASNYREEQKRLEAAMEQMKDQARRKSEQAEAQHKKTMQELKDKDDETRQKSEAKTRKLQEEMDKVRLDSKGMASNYQQEKRRQEEATKKTQDQARREREQAEAKLRKLQEEMDKVRLDSKGMASNYQEEKRRQEEATKKTQAQARREREQAEAQFKKQTEDLNKKMQETVKSSAAETKAMQERITQLQHQWDNRPRGGGGCIVI